MPGNFNVLEHGDVSEDESSTDDAENKRTPALKVPQLEQEPTGDSFEGEVRGTINLAGNSLEEKVGGLLVCAWCAEIASDAEKEPIEHQKWPEDGKLLSLVRFRPHAHACVETKRQCE